MRTNESVRSINSPNCFAHCIQGIKPFVQQYIPGNLGRVPQKKQGLKPFVRQYVPHPHHGNMKQAILQCVPIKKIHMQNLNFAIPPQQNLPLEGQQSPLYLRPDARIVKRMRLPDVSAYPNEAPVHPYSPSIFQKYFSNTSLTTQNRGLMQVSYTHLRAH